MIVENYWSFLHKLLLLHIYCCISFFFIGLLFQMFLLVSRYMQLSPPFICLAGDENWLKSLRYFSFLYWQINIFFLQTVYLCLLKMFLYLIVSLYSFDFESIVFSQIRESYVYVNLWSQPLYLFNRKDSGFRHSTNGILKNCLLQKYP